MNGSHLSLVLISVFLQFLLLTLGSAPGHFQKLGSHRFPDVAIDEVLDNLSPDDFWQHYVSSSRPAIFRGAAKHSPAFKKWTDAYLAGNFPNMEIRLEAKQEADGYLPRGDLGIGRDYLSNVVEYYHKTDVYVVSELPFPMYKDVDVLPCLSCGTFADRIQEINLWMSGGGTSSVLHRDAYHSINCLYNGTKEWLLIHPQYEDKIYMTVESKHEIGGQSDINVDAVDMDKFPLIQDIHYSLFTLNGGDCLFLPGGYWHQVRSFGTHNLAVAILFSRIKSFFGTDCQNADYKSLDQFDVVWVYNGTGVMSMGNMDVENLRELLLSFADENGRVHRETILQEIAEWYDILPENSRAGAFQHVSKAFDEHLDVSNVGYGTTEEIVALTRDQLKALALAIEPVEPSNSYEFEYSIFHEDDIRYVIEHLAHKKSLTCEEFVKDYTHKDKIFGSTKIANDVFAVLDKEGKGYVTEEELADGRLEAALEPFRIYHPRDSVSERIFVHNHDEL